MAEVSQPLQPISANRNDIYANIITSSPGTRRNSAIIYAFYLETSNASGCDRGCGRLGYGWWRTERCAWRSNSSLGCASGPYETVEPRVRCSSCSAYVMMDRWLTSVTASSKVSWTTVMTMNQIDDRVYGLFYDTALYGILLLQAARDIPCSK